jgi:hypothetical protein
MRPFLALLLGLAVVAFLAALATAPAPEIERPATLGMADLDRGREIIESLDLQHLAEGQERVLRIDQKDLTLALNWLAGSLGRGGAEVAIDRRRLQLRVSLRLYTLPRYLNLAVTMRPRRDFLEPESLRVGKVPLPATATTWLLDALLVLSPAAEQIRVARAMLRQARLEQGVLVLTLVWHGTEMRKAMQDGGWNPTGVDAAVLDRYRERLSGVKGKDYAVLLGEAFALAGERSGKHDPVAENRAALTALAEVAVGGRLLGAQGKALRKGAVHLSGRQDFAQHFALSAFIAAMGGEDVSDLAGLYKELRDARQGSGFSFTDLAADKAGSRFGELATRSPDTARALQKRLAGTHDELLILPAIKDLPEFMNQSQFERRFGGVGQPAYVKQVREIEARIAKLPLYRE